MKKYLPILIIVILSLNIFSFVSAKEIEIDFFYSPTCPHCAEEKIFLDQIKEKYPQIEINRHSLSLKENIELLKQFYQEYGVPSKNFGLVPVTFIEGKYFLGFSPRIEEDIEECIENLVEGKDQAECLGGEPSSEEVTQANLEKIEVPILGEINPKDYSLGALSVILGVLDGFNVCSLGALVLILGIVLALRSRRKTFVFGGLFILTTAIVYGILIVIWYQVFSLLSSYFRVMEILLGILGIGGGLYFLKEFFRLRKQGLVCEAETGKELMSRFSEKFKKSLSRSQNILLLIGMVILFAGLITIVEFPCSAVVPVAFAGILAKSGLSTFSYLLYISIFVLFYMLDEIIVFLAAVFTMSIWLSSSRVTVWIALIEALILFGLGAYYLLGFGFFI